MYLTTAKISLLTALLFIVSVVSLNSVEISEKAEISEISKEKINIVYRFSSHYEEPIGAEDINKICKRASLFNCSIEMADRKTIIFSGVRIPFLEIRGFILDNNHIEINFYHKYIPFSHILKPWNKIISKNLVLHYPTYIVEFANITDDIIENNFYLKTQYKKIDISAPEEVNSGNIIELPKIDGELCFVELKNNKTYQSYQESFSDCNSIRIPTDSRWQGDNWVLSLVNIRGDGIYYLSQVINFISPEDDIYITGDNSTEIGDNIEFIVNSENNIDAVEISVFDPENKTIYKDIQYNNKVYIPVNNSWKAGRYIVEFNVESDNKKVVLSSKFKVNRIMVPISEEISQEDNKTQQGNSVEKRLTEEDKKVFIEKAEYTAGEDIVIHINDKTPADYIETRIYDTNKNLIDESSCINCKKEKLSLDRALKSGTYFIETRYFHRGKLIDTYSESIQVREWSPLPDSEKELLCSSAGFYFQDAYLPCISASERCVATSYNLPLCLCFDEKDALIDICKSGEICGRDKCVQTVLSPYTVIRTYSKCVAMLGEFSFKCIYPGESCGGNCVCLDSDNTVISTCNIGEVCSRSGCVKPHLKFELKSFVSEEVTQSQLKQGYNFTWTGLLRIRDKIEKIQGNNINISVMIHDQVFPATVVQDSSYNIKISCSVRTMLTPGIYYIYLIFDGIVDNRIDRYIIKNKISVKYDNFPIYIEDFAVNPKKLAERDIKNGKSIEFRLILKDKDGNIIKTLPEHRINITIGNIAVKVTSVRYFHGKWYISGYIRSNKGLSPYKETMRRFHFVELPLNFTIESLGRWADYSDTIIFTERIPLTIRIVKTSPGQEYEPIFYLLFTLGFDMDIYLSFTGDFNTNSGKTTVFLGNRDISDKITYMIATVTGLKIHLSDITLCPDPPPPGKNTYLKVIHENRLGEIAQDSTTLYVRGNPGNWSNLEETSCV